jgi:hypothetical protein
MNPLGNRVPAMNPALQNIAETIRFAQTFKNPDAFIAELQRNNPEMAQYLMQLAHTIKNPSAAAEQMQAQQGITMQQLQAVLNQK